MRETRRCLKHCKRCLWAANPLVALVPSASAAAVSRSRIGRLSCQGWVTHTSAVGWTVAAALCNWTPAGIYSPARCQPGVCRRCRCRFGVLSPPWGGFLSGGRKGTTAPAATIPWLTSACIYTHLGIHKIATIKSVIAIDRTPPSTCQPRPIIIESCQGDNRFVQHQTPPFTSQLEQSPLLTTTRRPMRVPGKRRRILPLLPTLENRDGGKQWNVVHLRWFPFPATNALKAGKSRTGRRTQLNIQPPCWPCNQSVCIESGD